MCIIVHTVRLLVIGSKVLDTGTHIVLLDTCDIGGSGLTRHDGIFGIVLEVTAAERVTHNIEGWSQQHIGTIFLHFLTDGLSYFLNEFGVPCRGQQCSDGEMCTVIGGRITLTGSIDAQSGRTVGKNDSRDSNGVERIGGTSGTRHQVTGSANHGVIARETLHTCSDNKVSLVFERHLGHHFFLVNHVLGGFFGCSTAH